MGNYSAWWVVDGEEKLGLKLGRRVHTAETNLRHWSFYSTQSVWWQMSFHCYLQGGTALTLKTHGRYASQTEF